MPTNMKHMTLKIIPLITLCAGLGLLAAGCGKPAATQPQTEQTPPQAQTEQAKPTEAATTTPSAEAQKPTTTAQTKPATTVAKPTAKTPTSPAAKTPPTQQQVIANQLAPQTIYVTIKNGAFVPQVVSVKAGGTVVWVNKDTVPHTTRSDGSLLWDSGTLQPGASYRRVFKATGSYSYSCAVHPTSKGTVYVY